MRGLPVMATLIVAAAIAMMVALGVWQLQRMAWKNALLDDYAAAQGRPPIVFPLQPDISHPPLFRRAYAICAEVLDWRSASADGSG